MTNSIKEIKSCKNDKCYKDKQTAQQKGPCDWIVKHHICTIEFLKFQECLDQMPSGWLEVKPAMEDLIVPNDLNGGQLTAFGLKQADLSW